MSRNSNTPPASMRYYRLIAMPCQESGIFFSIREIDSGIYTSALGGTFMKWRKGGLGTNVQTPAEVKKRGGKKLVLGVSTNNMIQIRALIQNEFFPTYVNHVFVKHV